MSTFPRAVVFCFLLTSPSIAFAQGAAAPSTAPPARVDIDVPSVGLGFNSLGTGPTALYLGGSARVAARTGDGGFVSVSMIDSNVGSNILGPRGASSGGILYDAGYLRRVRLVGDDRFGLGLDLQAGVSVADLWFSQPSGGFCGFSCSTDRLEPVEERVADGLHVGANVGGSLDFRAWGFVVGIDVRYRVLGAFEAGEPGDRREQHVATAGVHLGVGIY